MIRQLHISDTLSLPLDLVIQRFELNVIKGGGCWEWQGYLKNGYGFTEFSEVGIYAHRLSWLIHKGDISNGLQVLHECDNPPCVKPSHLFLGKAIDNVHDMRRKGRAVDPPILFGSANYQTTLTDVEIAAILSASGCQREVARRFGVSQSTVWRIRHGIERKVP